MPLIPKEVSLDLLDIDILPPSHGYEESPTRSSGVGGLIAIGSKGRHFHERISSAHHITSNSPNRCLRGDNRNVLSSNVPSTVHDAAADST